MAVQGALSFSFCVESAWFRRYVWGTQRDDERRTIVQMEAYVLWLRGGKVLTGVRPELFSEVE